MHLACRLTERDVANENALALVWRHGCRMCESDGELLLRRTFRQLAVYLVFDYFGLDEDHSHLHNEVFVLIYIVTRVTRR
jgi:hypothetical protein